MLYAFCPLCICDTSYTRETIEGRVLTDIYPSKSGIRGLIPDFLLKSRVLVYTEGMADNDKKKMASAGKHALPEDIRIPTADMLTFDQMINAESIAAVSGLSASIKSTVIEPNLLFSLFSQKEAETSTRIEGTDVTFEDIALEEDEERGTPKTRSARREALGVIDAIYTGKNALEKENLPISNRMIRLMHESLMKKAALDQGVPGEFRKEKVRIGVRYYPPEPQYVSDLMSDLERYMHDDSTNISPMVRIAVIHAQFEIIHPFSDGNGRIGRLLIPFLMKEYGLTDDVSFFISPYLERYRNEYYNSLENITKRNDWNTWVNFFLQSVTEHGKEMKNRVDALIQLYTDGTFLALKNIDSQNIKNYIFRNPIFTVPSMVRHFEERGESISNKNDLHRILTHSPDIEILTPGKGKRQTNYICKKIIDALQRNS